MIERFARPPEVAREVKLCALDVKTVALDGRFEGYASLFNREDMGHDIVLPGAFRDTLKGRTASDVRMLFQHDPNQPIGVWDKIQEDARGLFVRGRLATEVMKAREVLWLMRDGAIDGLSIGFRMLKGARDRQGIRRLEKIDLWEISVVTFPMQPGARVTSVKSGAVAHPAPTVRELERWLTHDAGFTRSQARALLREGYKGLGPPRDAGPGEAWRAPLAARIAEAARLVRASI